MKQQTRKTIYKRILGISSNNLLQVTLSIILIFVCFIIASVLSDNGFELKKIFNDVLINIVAGVISANVIIGVFRIVLAKIKVKSEDYIKLSIDYDNLSMSYLREPLLKYTIYSCQYETEVLARDKSSCLKLVRNNPDGRINVTIPLSVVYQYKKGKIPKSLVIIDVRNSYHLPTPVQVYMKELLEAHGHSHIYNRPMVRINDIAITNGAILMKAGETSYFYSLITNRAMDYPIGDGLTLRSMYEYKPQLTPLSESALSNHLGLHIAIVTDDGYLIFIMRLNTVSIAKNTLGIGVQAAVKARDSRIMGTEEPFSNERLLQALKIELENELGLNNEHYDELNADKLNEHLVSIYRELVEGGKPQMLFSLSLRKGLTAKNFVSLFNDKRKKDKRNKKMRRDGNKLWFMKKNDWNSAYIVADGIAGVFSSAGDILKNRPGKLRWFDMVPTTSGSVAMFFESERYI